MILRKLLLAVPAILLFANSCTNIEERKTVPVAASGIPAYVLQSNIYEVNVRQYTPEGTFKAFEAHLPRLKEM